MTLFIVVQYFSLMFALVSIIRLIPFRKIYLPKLLMRLFLCVANILAVVFMDHINVVLAVSIVIVTAIFTEGVEFIDRYVSKNYLRLVKSNSIVLKIKYALSPHPMSAGFLIMAKAMVAFENKDIDKATRLLTDHTVKTGNDLLWVSNCMLFLSAIDQHEIAYTLLQSVPVDLTQKNIDYAYLRVAISISCHKQEFEQTEAYLDYIETHYYDAQHQLANLYAYLIYYSNIGDLKSFDKIITDSPALEKSPHIGQMRTKLKSMDSHVDCAKKPKSYQFSFATVTNKKAVPIFIFAGVISVVTLIQLVFSEGGTMAERVLSGYIYPLEYYRFGAAVKSLISAGQWIRLITPVFLHAGLLHLAMNVIGLIVIGKLLYLFLDKYVLLFIFFGGAVIGNILSFFYSDALLSVGASGGVFSLLGVMFVYFLWHRKEINRSVFNRIIINFALIAAVQIGMSIQIPNIDNYAHIGGFLGGVLLTLLYLSLKNTSFHTYYLNFAKLLLGAMIVALALYWPPLFTQNIVDQIKIDTSVSVSDIEFSIPSTWEKEGDRYFDILLNSQIVISVNEKSLSIENQINETKRAYTQDSKYKFSSETHLKNGWRSLAFVPIKAVDSSNIYYFCKLQNGKLIEFFLFIKPEVYTDYLPVFEKVLYSTNSR